MPAYIADLSPVLPRKRYSPRHGNLHSPGFRSDATHPSALESFMPPLVDTSAVNATAYCSRSEFNSQSHIIQGNIGSCANSQITRKRASLAQGAHRQKSPLRAIREQNRSTFKSSPHFLYLRIASRWSRQLPNAVPLAVSRSFWQTRE